MIRTRETGWTRVQYANGNFCSVALEHFEALRAAWQTGATFWSGFDNYGDPMTIKLGAVVEVAAVTPAAIEAARLDREAERAEDAIRGVE